MPAPHANHDLEEGYVFQGKYQILRELGRGGFGVVYLAHQIAMDRPVALKVLRPGAGEHDPSARERFLREVKIISKLRHPNTVTIHDYGETSVGMVYMVLEYVEGKTLKTLIRNQGAQTPMRSLGLSRQIAGSLAEAHQQGIIHRDLKPANIMLTDLEGDDDFVKVLDFGVAHLLNNEDVDLTRSSVPEGHRALIGTPRYMSPEQVRGENLTPASDLYGLGLMLYEMLVGEPAVQGDTTMALISQQISPEPLRLPGLRGLPGPIQSLIRKATDKSIEARFRSGRQFATAIDETAQSIADLGDAREFVATSGRFSAVSRGAVAGLASDSSPALNRNTPSASSQNHPPGGPESGDVLRAGAAAGAARGVEWAENHFEPSELQQRSETGAEIFPAVDTPSSGDSRSEHTVDGSESRLYGVSSSDLPPPPEDRDSPFAPEPEPEDRADDTPTPDEADDQSAAMTAFVSAKLGFLAILAFFFTYTAFIVLGALIGEFTEGSIRLVVAGAVAVAIPLFSALGENSQKERFEVVERPSDRVARVFIGTAIFSAATIVIMSFAMPGQITAYLRGDANWMFERTPGVEYEPTPITNLNRDFSEVVADMIEGATRAIGRYDGTPTLDDEEIDRQPRPQIYTPPEPTRPATRQREATDDDGQVTDETEEHQNSRETDGAEQIRQPSTSPPPTRPGNRSDDDEDYVSW